MKQGVRILLPAFFLCLVSLPLFADSQVRIVRLSSVEGDVQIDRHSGPGFEKAFLNLPVTENARIRTGADGYAEVEFEDGSALRISPQGSVGFPQLELRDSGAKASTVLVNSGTVYLNFSGEHGAEFTLLLDSRKIVLTQPVHLRIEKYPTATTIAVFKGSAEIEGASGTITLGKHQSLTLAAPSGKDLLAKDVADGPYDDWDSRQDEYHKRYLKAANYSSPYGYGFSDLNYYGGFAMVPGYGWMWQPYFVSAGWDPFMTGSWAWYPGGYSWVSAYPWGWLPYHSGNWAFVSGWGWMWQPGSSWTGLGNIPRPVNPPAGFMSPRQPSSAVHTLVSVNRQPGIAPAFRPSGRITIRQDTAGLGIPRDGIRNMSRMSQQVQQHGFARASVHPTAMGFATRPVASGSGFSAPPSSMRPPSSSGGGPSMSGGAGSYGGSRPSSQPSGGAPSFHGSSSGAPSGSHSAPSSGGRR